MEQAHKLVESLVRCGGAFRQVSNSKKECRKRVHPKMKRVESVEFL